MLWPDDVTDEQLALAAASHEEHDSDNERSRQDVLDDAMFAPPIDKWRHGYLWVSHLVSQLWCEQQMEYGFTRSDEIKEEPQHVDQNYISHVS
jgi:hypothetical protein